MKTIKLSTAHDLHIHLSDFYDQIAFDNSPEFKEYIPHGIWFSLYEKDCFAGFITLDPINNVTWIAHIMIYKQFRGNKSEQWGLQVIDYMKNNLRAEKFIALTPYITARKYAEKVGMKTTAILHKSIKKNGTLLDQYMLATEE
jgi:hypothetical protein